MGRIQDKVAVVIGASSPGGLGEYIARRFAAEGAKVVVSGRRKAECDTLAAEIGGMGVACDIGKEDQVEALIKAAVDTYGRLDVAVNASGLNQPVPVAQLTPENLQPFIDAHFIGPIMFIKHAAAAMAAKPDDLPKGGSIMTLSSLTVELTGPGLANYAGTKAGIDKIVQIAAVEYGPMQIRINSLSPGLVPSPMTNQMLAVPSLKAAFDYESPMGRLCTAEEVAAAALWLADDECTLTGDRVRISGGAHLRRLPTGEEMMGQRKMG